MLKIYTANDIYIYRCENKYPCGCTGQNLVKFKIENTST